MVVIVMGVAGSGKTTVASALASELKWDFLDADSFHSPGNVAKMRAGIALDDTDRVPWLDSLREEIQRCLARKRNLALACSALKASYREHLMVSRHVKLVYLKGNFDALRDRLTHRTGHFMPGSLLVSQLETLEEPADAITVEARLSPEEIVAEICAQLCLR